MHVQWNGSKPVCTGEHHQNDVTALCGMVLSGEGRPPVLPAVESEMLWPPPPSSSIRVRDVAPAGSPPHSSDYRTMEQRILFLLICIGKGLSWMVREVKFKAQRCFEGQWERGPFDDGRMEEATLDWRELESPGTCSFLLWSKLCCCSNFVACELSSLTQWKRKYYGF